MEGIQVETTRRDPLRRFTPTPHADDLAVMGRTLSLATNSPSILHRARRIFHQYARRTAARPEFLWRIVCEADEGLMPLWPEMKGFSDDGLRSISFGQRSFLAIDLEAREAVAFLPERLAEDEPGFTSLFLATLFYMTAGALRLTSISAACVARGGKGLLVFGPPNSGKTTSSYLAGKLGLDFHADMVTFLEIEGGTLGAWGEFWPAAFRVETVEYLPELLALTRPVQCGDRTLLYLEKAPAPAEVRSVIPAFCIFLERQAAEVPRLIPLSGAELAAHLQASVPFRDDERFESQRAAIFRALGGLQAYRLVYGSDPATAAIFFRSLLSAHHLLEAQV